MFKQPIRMDDLGVPPLMETIILFTLGIPLHGPTVYPMSMPSSEAVRLQRLRGRGMDDKGLV